MGYRRTYTRTANPAIASYSYVDIADGTGVQKFYGAKTKSGFILTPQTLYSELIFTSVNAPYAAAVLLDNDFDVTFNMPKTVKGTLIVNVPFIHEVSTSGLRTFDVTITVQRVSNGVSTTIGTDTATQYSDTGTGQTAANFRERIVSVALTQTHFKKGDTLRIHVKLDIYNANGNCLFYTYHDPAGRAYGSPVITDGTINTQMVFYVPFRIDL